MQTAEIVGLPFKQYKILNEIDGGICDGLSREEMNQKVNFSTDLVV